jgi:hypothetical protein
MTTHDIAVSDHDCPGIHEPVSVSKVVTKRVKIVSEGGAEPHVWFELEGYPKFKVKSVDVHWAMSGMEKPVYALIEATAPVSVSQANGNIDML